MVADSTTVEQPLLGIELRFRAGPPPQAWEGVLQATLAWAPQLQPTHVDRLSDMDALEAEPWSTGRVSELARRLANESNLAWMLFQADTEVAGITMRRKEDEVEMSIRLPWQSEKPSASSGVRDELLRLLHALESSVCPALGMAYDANSPDAEMIMQGMRGLKDIPPLLYLDAGSAACAGGIERLRRAPCETLDAPCGGILLVIRPLPWGPPSPEEQNVIIAVKNYLEITPDKPLVLA